MAYTSSGRLPIERASKIGHIKIIQEPRIQRLIEAFEKADDTGDEALGELSGKLNLSQVGSLENVVAIDGSEVAIPNTLKEHKRIAFITVGAVVLKRSEIARMKANPVIDPRDLAKQMQEGASTVAAALPLSGVVVPGETLVDSIRKTVDEVLRYTRLYDTLRFLVSREWLPSYSGQEHMGCVRCRGEFPIPRSTLQFRCPHCGELHTLSDYLSIAQGPPHDFATEEAAISLRNIMESLYLMRFLKTYKDRPVLLQRTLFVKDGPLLLRAQLSRLIEPIRAFLKYLKDQGTSIHVVGVEKTGDLVDHIPLISHTLNEPGDFFIPTVRYLLERILGVPYVEAEYRNRVQYGSKVVVRLGPDHVVAFNIPTGDFLTEPKVEELYGFGESMALLSEMLSYSYENALVPLVIANSIASISMQPSTDILEAFARRLLGGQ
ncbi:MAG: hypothetical protein M1305_00575 [Candidatus Marsarchaeota archaeon]|nr:hypothetical protein [Candidatus Marsarchaeota archaeon]